MAITISEVFTSPSTEDGVGGGGATVTFIYHGDANEQEPAIRAAVEANIPGQYSGLILDRFTIDRMEADGWWTVVGRYKPGSQAGRLPPDPGEATQWSIRGTSSGTQKRLLSLALLDEAWAFNKWNISNSPKHARVLGLSKNAEGGFEADGADVPVGSIDITARIAVDVQSNATFLVTAASHAAQSAVNTDLWKGFAAKTLRITSFDATQRAETTVWDINYAFNFTPFFTIEGLGLNKSLTVPGQYFADVAREDAKVTNLDYTVPAIARVGVHQLFPEINYSTSLLV